MRARENVGKGEREVRALGSIRSWHSFACECARSGKLPLNLRLSGAAFYRLLVPGDGCKEFQCRWRHEPTPVDRCLSVKTISGQLAVQCDLINSTLIRSQMANRQCEGISAMDASISAMTGAR